MTAREHGMLGDLLGMREKMERMLSDREAALKDDGAAGSLAGWRPEVDVIESDDELIVEAELPGLAREEFTLTIQGRDLILEGERKSVAHPGRARRLQVERRYGPFQRLICLPVDVEGDSISATLVDGVLKITIPKKSRPEGRRVAVQAHIGTGSHAL